MEKKTLLPKRNPICDSCKHRFKEEQCMKAKSKKLCPFENQHKDFAEKMSHGRKKSDDVEVEQEEELPALYGKFGKQMMGDGRFEI